MFYYFKTDVICDSLSNSDFISNFPNLSVTSSLFDFCTVIGRSGALLSSTLSACDSAWHYKVYNNTQAESYYGHASIGLVHAYENVTKTFMILHDRTFMSVIELSKSELRKSHLKLLWHTCTDILDAILFCISLLLLHNKTNENALCIEYVVFTSKFYRPTMSQN